MRFVSCVSAAAMGIMVAASSASASAILSDWVGLNNTVGGNNFGLIDSSTVGGLVRARNSDPAYFADLSLAAPAVGGVLAFNPPSNTSLDGAQFKVRLTTNNPDNNVYDPSMVIGYFSNTATGISGAPNLGVPQLRAGFTLADNGSPAGSFRIQVVGGGPNQGTSNIGVLNAGTYDIVVDIYPGTSDNVQVRVYDLSGTLLMQGSRSLTTSASFDSFGILLPGGTGTTNDAFPLTLTNIEYTGMSIPEPATLGALAGIALVGLRRSRK